jgi:lipopolysaccharide exporter
MGYFKDTVKGLSWMGGFRVVTRVIAFLKIAILARLLVPEQFGIFGIASLVLAFLEILTETGINVFFIQDEGKIKDYLDTAWIVSIVRGILISLAILLFAPVISSFFNSPGSYKLLVLISLVPFLRGFINPAIVRFQKELEFNKEFWFRFAVFLFDASVAVVLALITKSAASLVWGLIAGVVLEIVLSFMFVKPRPKFALELAKVKRVISRGKWVTAYSIFDYLFRQGDDIVVGRLLNISSLGLYQVAYKISTLPITEVADVFGKVSFPVFVKISDDTERLKKAFLKTFISVGILTLPFTVLFLLFPKQIILLILGDKWLEAVPVLKLLSLFGLIRGLSGPTSALFLALRKQEYVSAVTFVSTLGLAVTIVPLVLKYGIVGAGLSALAGAIVAWPLIIFYLFKVF